MSPADRQADARVGSGGVGVDPAALFVALGARLRDAGVPASTGRVLAAVDAASVLDPTRRHDLYWAGRLALCTGPDDVARYDAVFDALVSGRLHDDARTAPTPHGRTGTGGRDAAAGDDDEQDRVVAAASRRELLRTRDIAALDDDERAELQRMLAAWRLADPLRRSHRHSAARRGELDRPRSTRALLRAGGEPARLVHRRRRDRSRPVVLLVDVSGSMAPYADALLRLAHAALRARPGGTEVFTIGTRLTRVTRELRQRDVDRALAAVAARVPDRGGGTRLGELLREFCDRWAQRGPARGAVVVVLSDGWERGDAALLGRQTARLARLAHHLVWANPRKGRDGYEPLVAGMAAALPHVDAFVAGHSLAAFEQVARLVATAARVRPTRFAAGEEASCASS